jgi:hypothetical protein
MMLLLMAPAPAAAQAEPKSGLTRMLEAELARFPATVGLYVKHLVTGEEPYGEFEDRIGRVAQLIVDYFDGVR